MKKLFIGGLVVSSLLCPIRAFAYDDGGDYGNGNDQRRCHNSENCRGSFSPGPFDRSPVEIDGNTVCMPGATCYYGDPKKKDQQPSENR
jgi:hypothetical protein